MKLIRFADEDGTIHLGVQHPDRVTRVSGDIFGQWKDTAETMQPARLLVPVMPVQLFCIGLNYRRHAEETGARIPSHPVLFMKGINSVQDPEQPIVLPRHLRSDQVDYECELVVIIGRRAKNVSVENALDYVLGYTCGNDVSAREWQKDFGGSQWCRGKTFDTFAPMGPCLVTPEDISNPNDLGIRTLLNGQAVQDWNTSDMIFSVPELVAFLSGSTTLLPGTAIFTGTPHGVGMARTPPLWLAPGDEVVVEIDGIGRLRNPVQAE